jgi:hypothetical protein
MTHALAAMSEDPRSYSEAMHCPDAPKWKGACNEEYQSLMDNHTWDVVDLPPGRKAVKSKWVFKIKENPDGTVDRYKAHLVAKGFAQKYSGEGGAHDKCNPNNGTRTTH